MSVALRVMQRLKRGFTNTTGRGLASTDTAECRLSELAALAAAYRALEEDTAALRAARAENRLFITEYAYYPASRPLAQAAGGRQVEAMLLGHRAKIERTLRGVARHAEGLARIPRQSDGTLSPWWQNDWFPPFDGSALYGLIAENRPGRYIEVGSGISTRFARRAISDLGLQTRIVSIDPHPNTPIAGLCDETIVSRMEDMPPQFWGDLAADDMVFIDNSHRSFSGSDVTVFFSEVMPALPPGVIYGMHDIFLPGDYPDAWKDRYFNEQYLLMAYLLGGAGGDEILLPVAWAESRADLHGLLSSLWARKDLFDGVGTHGGAFWLRRKGPGSAGVSA